MQLLCKHTVQQRACKHMYFMQPMLLLRVGLTKTAACTASALLL
jgi:hypothetical protein